MLSLFRDRKFLHPRQQFDVPLSGHIRNVRQKGMVLEMHPSFPSVQRVPFVHELTEIKSPWFPSEPPGSSTLTRTQAHTYGKGEVAKQHFAQSHLLHNSAWQEFGVGAETEQIYLKCTPGHSLPDCP